MNPRRERDFCSLPDCDRPLFRLGLCQAHCKQLQRGQVLHPIKERLSPAEAALVAALELADADAENDKAWLAARERFQRAVAAWLKSKGWSPPAEVE